VPRIVSDSTCHVFCIFFGRSQWPRVLRSGQRELALWDCSFKSRRGHGNYSVLSVVCCQVEVSASGRSLVQRSPTESGMSNESGREDL
jgi:hypothetical protein